jgi:two-component system response regulator HydG
MPEETDGHRSPGSRRPPSEASTPAAAGPEGGQEGARPLSVLVVDDEDDFRRTCELTVRSFGHRTASAASAAEALDRLAEDGFDVCLLDILMPDQSGLQALHGIRAEFPEVEVVMMSGHASVPWAVEAIKAGAADYLVKPFEAEALRRALAVAARTGRLARENRRLRRALDTDPGPVARFVEAVLPGVRRPAQHGDAGPVTLVGRSRAMRDLRRLMRKVAASDVSVLLLGESGTGKEVAARTIHAASARREGPFVPVDCGAIAESLIESELFGHVRGAFTGADRDREGLVGSADGGTLLLDEVGDLSPGAQVRLLRVVESGELRPVGSSETRRVDVRVMAATNRDLEREESFRRDLFFRLNVVTVAVPPLRERREDVPLLAEHFLARHRRSGSVSERFSPEAMAALEAYGWPGNVRELENVVERCSTLATGLAIERKDLPPEVAAGAPAPEGPLRSLDEIKREAITRTLEAVGYDRAKAAAILGIDRSTLYRNMRQYGLAAPRKRAKRGSSSAPGGEGRGETSQTAGRGL